MRPFAASDAVLSSSTLAPGDLATLYDIAPLYQMGIDGTGQKIAIVGTTEPVLSDVQTFRSTYGLSAPNIQTILTGADPGLDVNSLPEADLDLEWSGGIAHGAKLIYVYATDPDVAAFYAIDQNLAPVVSESFGVCEPQVSASSVASYEMEAKKANTQGITWVIASGDAGAATCDNGSPSPVATRGLA